MEITVNGEPREVPGPLSVAQLLERLQINPQAVAVERNRTIVAKGNYGSEPVEAGDEFEIIRMVGGG